MPCPIGVLGPLSAYGGQPAAPKKKMPTYRCQVPPEGLPQPRQRGILASLIHWIAMRCFLPSQIFFKSTVQKAKHLFAQRTSHFSKREYKIITKDGVPLRATYLRICEQENVPTIVVFNASGEIRYDDGVFPLLRANRFNVVLFDYRGTGDSGDRAKELQDLVTDGEAIFEWVTASSDQGGLGIPGHLVGMYGRSLGGAIGAIAKSNDQNLSGPNFIDRSFTSLRGVAVTKYPCCRRLIEAIYRPDEDLNTERARLTLRGRTFITSHLNDSMIGNCRPYGTRFLLDHRDPRTIDPHNSPLSCFTIHDMTRRIPAENLLLDFLSDVQPVQPR